MSISKLSMVSEPEIEMNGYIACLHLLSCLQAFRLKRQWNQITHLAGRLSAVNDKCEDYFIVFLALTCVHIAICWWIFVGKFSK